jgi:type IX secretion system PorP/SprF family membrane protein
VKKNVIILIIILTASIKVVGQDNFYVSQYFQVGPLLNPAFTGIDNFMDIKINYRNQWGGFSDAPTTNYIGINGYLQKETQQSYKQYALRTSNPYFLDSLEVEGISPVEPLRHGIGGNIIYDVQGPFEQISGYINYAVHVPLSKKLKMSIGVSGVISNQRIDLEKITLQNPDDDDFYQSLIAAGGKNTYLSVNPGIALYSDRFYFSYTPQNIIRSAISTDEILSSASTINHLIMAGYKFPLNNQVSLLPSILLSQSDEISNQWDTNLKVLIKERTWAGLSYRSSGALVFMAGVYINNMFNLSYSYDYVTSELNNYSNGSHELILGLMLFKRDTKAPILW